LGTTLAEIAREKGGIIKRGTPAVLGALPEEAAREIRRLAEAHDASLTEASEHEAACEERGSVHIQGLDGAVPSGPIVGPALRENLAVAFTLFEKALALEGRRPSYKNVSRAILSLKLPARLELFDGDPPVIIDSAHTLESIRALRMGLEEIGLPTPRTLVFSLAQGKAVQPILGELPRIAEEIILTRADPVRSVPPQDLRAQVERARVVESPRDALELAIKINRPVVVTGSFYLAGLLRRQLRDRRGDSP
jgi:dihydrofolate synthase/folylpolyglutamate synthase